MLSWKRLAPSALALWVAAGVGMAEEPSRLPLEPIPPPTSTKSMNQQLADTVAGQIRSSGRLSNYRIEVFCARGIAELQGAVGTREQRDEAARLAQSVPGVTRVLNRLSVPGDKDVTRADYPVGPLAQNQLPPPERVGPGSNDPIPSFRASPQPHGEYRGEAPPLPPHAWPTYAPYNNYSRVAYPSSYPPEAWPNIGPFYPFPQVPLGWRKVVLEWDDGHWWMSTKAQQHDWWTIRYW